LRDLRPQRLGVLAGAVDHHDEIVRVTDQSIGRATTLADALAPIARLGRLPDPSEVIVEGRQCDVGEQRGQDATL
jgi:hypothetical protein